MDNTRKNMLDFLKIENDYITYLLEAFEVPETVESKIHSKNKYFHACFSLPLYNHILDESDDDEYLLEVPKKKQKLMVIGNNVPAETSEELQERSEVIKRKLEKRKAGKKSNTVTKSERRKLKQEKLQKKQQVLNRRKTLNNEILKQERGVKAEKVKIKNDPDKTATTNGDIPPASKVYNKEGKLFFSKIKIDGEKKKVGQDTNPRAHLQKLAKEKKKIQELVESGDKQKAKEVKQKMLWEKAFDKTEGIKVKDNVEILKKTIKKRTKLKKKSKVEWQDRKNKIEEKKSTKSKKREENLNKRITDKKKTKLKHAVKKGRIIKGVTG